MSRAVRVRAKFARVVDDGCGGCGVVLEGTTGRVIGARRLDKTEPAAMVLDIEWACICLDTPPGPDDDPRLDAPKWDEFGIDPAGVEYIGRGAE